MRYLLGFLLGLACSGQTLKIPPVKTSLQLEGQPVEIVAWGTVTPGAKDTFQLAMTADLKGLQENLTPILAAQLNQSEKCGARMTVNRALLDPAAPMAVLTAYVHYERFGCVKALGKEIVKRLVGGDGVVVVNLTPSVDAGRVLMAAHVVKVDADGSLGEVLRSGSLGDSIREKIRASIESAIQKSVNLKATLPAAIADVATMETVQFADGGTGGLWLNISGDVRLPAEQFQDLAKRLAH